MGKSTPSPATGLTLLELMITLAVLAVLGALAWPSMGAQLERQRLRHAAQTLAGDISEARFMAAQRGQTVHLDLHEGPAWCWTVSLSSACACGSPTPSCSIHSVTPRDHPGVKLLEPLQLHMDPGGLPGTPTATTLESASGAKLRVEVSAQGRARVCALEGKWPQLPVC
jgi:type IV fimbrial biogenesis protein FimT